MLKTASVTQLRAELAAYLERVGEGSVVVVFRSQPAAVLLEPQDYEAVVEAAETLEDVLDGLAGLERYAAEPGSAVDAEEVFARLGHSWCRTGSSCYQASRGSSPELQGGAPQRGHLSGRARALAARQGGTRVWAVEPPRRSPPKPRVRLAAHGAVHTVGNVYST